MITINWLKTSGYLLLFIKRVLVIRIWLLLHLREVLLDYDTLFL